MKKDFGNATHDYEPVDPVKFRAIATGIGQGQAQSEASGRVRSQRVSDSMPPKARAALPADGGGYPAPTPVDPLWPSTFPFSKRANP
jgi:hypothetical protein